MQEEEYLEYLTQNATNLNVYGASKRMISPSRARKDYATPVVYTGKTVCTLLNTLNSIGYSIRFVCNTEGTPLFGSTGPLQGSTPGHDEMSGGLCLTAGLLSFHHSSKKITKIACNSGFFKPELKSLIWILHYLFSRENEYLDFHADKVTIEYYDNNSWLSFDVSVNSLRGIFTTLSPTSAEFTVGVTVPYMTFSEKSIQHEFNEAGSPCSKSAGWISISSVIPLAHSDEPLNKRKLNSPGFFNFHGAKNPMGSSSIDLDLFDELESNHPSPKTSKRNDNIVGIAGLLGKNTLNRYPFYSSTHCNSPTAAPLFPCEEEEADIENAIF